MLFCFPTCSASPLSTHPSPTYAPSARPQIVGLGLGLGPGFGFGFGVGLGLGVCALHCLLALVVCLVLPYFVYLLVSASAFFGYRLWQRLFVCVAIDTSPVAGCGAMGSTLYSAPRPMLFRLD